jgi:hypothetical protein
MYAGPSRLDLLTSPTDHCGFRPLKRDPFLG